MDSYEINKETCCILAMDQNISRVIEGENEYYVNLPSYDIMDNSCQYYGSTVEGRIKGTRQILGSNYKVPIVIEEINNIIFFPTESPSRSNCNWISLNQIKSYCDEEGFTKVTFNNNKYVLLKMSINSFENQVLRANRLESILRKRSCPEK